VHVHVHVHVHMCMHMSHVLHPMSRVQPRLSHA
jgi:hypothetical protein